MIDWNKFAMIAGIIMLVIAVVIAVYKVMRIRAGEAGEKKRVSKLLRSYAKPRGFQVLDDTVLISDGLSGWADHILVGHFGVLLVYDLCWSGEYFGTVDEENWVLRIPDKGRFKIENPLRTAAPHCIGRINTLLKAEGIKLSVDTVAVITGAKKKTTRCINAENIILITNLRKYLNKVKFEEDRDVNVDAVAAILKQALKQGDA